MARGPRLIVDNSIYHIMVRGNQKQATFLEKEDFAKYLELLRHYKKDFKFKLYGYCLMPNHVHIVLGVGKGVDLIKIMQGLNLTYAMWFNEKYKKVGHLWQGRYKSMIIENIKYLVDCIEYVEFNPIRSDLSGSSFDYPWSSAQARAGFKKDSLLDTPKTI